MQTFITTTGPFHHRHALFYTIPRPILRSGKDHYDAINVSQIEANISAKIQTKSIDNPCRCGLGSVKRPIKPFVLITVLDANVFRKYKVAATTADVEIATILMEMSD